MTDHHSTGRQHRLAARRLRPTLLSLAAAALLVGALSVRAQPAARDIDIPAQPLDKALGALARQTGARILFSTDLTERKQAPALKGNLTPQQALERLLAGSGLVVRSTSDGGFTIASRPPEAGGETTLPAVRVKASREQETATGPVTGYVAKRSATATKTDTPLVETPQSISVIGAEEIQIRGATSLFEAIGYTAGVAATSVRSGAADRTNDSFLLRGFDMDPQSGNFYRDGTKYTVNPYNGRQEPYGLERLELLKGASSVLYGTAAPGGIINSVSKRPTTEPLRELNVEVGSFGRKQVAGDFGGALSTDNTWSYRLTGLTRDSDTSVDHVPDDRTYLASAVKWLPRSGTSLTLLAEYQKDRTGYLNPLPVDGTLLPNINGPLSRSLYVGEPSHDKFVVARYSVGYLFEHGFSDTLKLRHSLRYFHTNVDYPGTFISVLGPDQRTVDRSASDRQDRSASVVADTSLQYKWSSANVAHTTLVGLDVVSQRHETERYFLSAEPLDLYAPVYSGVGDVRTPNDFSGRQRQKQLGLYLQDQMKIADRWVMLLGGRHDRVRFTDADFFTPGLLYADNEKSSATTGRAGLVYLADNGLAPFASFGQSFEPQSGFDRLGNRFSPTRGDQWELGLRYQPKDSETLLSAAVYDLTRSNVLVTDPVDTFMSVQMGKVRSRGVEIEARTRLNHHANLIAAYSYTDARIIESSPVTPEQVGKRSGGVPYNQVSLWSDYSFGEFGIAGLKMGVGARYVGATRATYLDVVVPAFTVFDALISYSTGPWRLAVNASNLANKNYVANCTYGCFYGEPRKVVATATYRW